MSASAKSRREPISFNLKPSSLKYLGEAVMVGALLARLLSTRTARHEDCVPRRRGSTTWRTEPNFLERNQRMHFMSRLASRRSGNEPRFLQNELIRLYSMKSTMSTVRRSPAPLRRNKPNFSSTGLNALACVSILAPTSGYFGETN